MEMNKKTLAIDKIIFIALTLFGLMQIVFFNEPVYKPYSLGFILIYLLFSHMIISSFVRDLPKIKLIKLVLSSILFSVILTFIIYQIEVEPLLQGGLWYTYNKGLPFTIYHFFMSDTFEKTEYYDYYGLALNLTFYTVGLFYLSLKLKFPNKLTKPINENSN